MLLGYSLFLLILIVGLFPWTLFKYYKFLPVNILSMEFKYIITPMCNKVEWYHKLYLNTAAKVVGPLCQILWKLGCY